MKRYKNILITSHIISNLLIQMTVVTAIVFYYDFDQTIGKLYHLFVCIVLIADTVISCILLNKCKESLNTKRLVLLQGSDWPIAILGIASIFVFKYSNNYYLGFYTAAVELIWMLERIVILIIMLPKQDAAISNDEVIDLLSATNHHIAQEKGIELAKQLSSYSLLIMPPGRKDTWENCAKVLQDKNDIELLPYLPDLFYWASTGEPGAVTIYNRLIQYSLCVDYNETLTECIETARARKDEYGEQVLNQLKDEYKEKQKGVLAAHKKML